MAKNTPQNENETGATSAGKQPRILKFGLLAAPAAVKATGPCVLGRFGKMEIPLDIDGQRFILPIAPNNPQYEACRVAFGEPDTWAGCTFQVSDGKMLKQVNVVPIADAKGRPV